MTPTVAIRADGSQGIGMGHIMRCIGLAQEFRARAYQVVFISAVRSAQIEALVTSFGMDYVASDLEIGSADDLAFTLATCRDREACFLVVDGYRFGADWLSGLRSEGLSAMLWTDYCQAQRLPVDLILDQTPADNFVLYEAASAANTLILNGLEYAVLRDEFLRHPGIRRLRESVERVLVTFGGADPIGATVKVTEILLQTACDVHFDIVVGPANTRVDEVRVLVENKPNFSLHVATKEMARLVSEADLAISAAGTSLWEFAYSGLPTIATVIADNQILLADSLERLQCSVNLGRIEAVRAETLEAELARLLADTDRLRTFSQRMMRLVDGEGRARVVDSVEAMLRE